MVKAFVLRSLILTFGMGFFVSCHSMTMSSGSGKRSEKNLETQLFFGMTDSMHTPIAPEAWQRFQDTCLSRFLDGFTIVGAEGGWRSSSGSQFHEPAKLILYLHKGSSSEEANIDRVRTSYMRSFRQISVLRVDVPVRVLK